MSRWWNWFAALLCVLTLASCEYVDVTTQTGYKGRARINPWLAAERFAQAKGHQVKSLPAWRNPQWEDKVYFVPASLLTNEGFIRPLDQWVNEGGHLVVMVEHAEAEWNDWRPYTSRGTRLEPALFKFLEQAGLTLEAKGEKKPVTELLFDGRKFAVDAEAEGSIAAKGKEPGIFASKRYGSGRISVLMDARIFRNRNIGDKEHAALLDALIGSDENEGSIVFIRGSGISLWKMLREHLGPVLIGLSLIVVLWLWKNFKRFGPMEPVTTASPLRGYDHHLEALGDFQWRLDHAAALLAPLRERIVESGQKMATKSGKRDEDFFQVLADRAGLTRERVLRALAEAAPSDSGTLVRTTADIQKLLQVLRS